MKTLLAAVIVSAAAVLLPLRSQAAPSINGQITFFGGAQLNGVIGGANQFVSIYDPAYGPPDGPTSSAATGAYSLVAGGTEALFTDFVFKPNPSVVSPLFTLTTSGETYSFDITSTTYFHQDSMFISMAGTGVAHITGTTTYADTPGTWSITLTGTSSTQTVGTFGAYIVVPEPTVATLFLGLGAAALLRNRFRQSK